MAETLLVYEVGDRFATITRAGKATIWEVDNTGRPVEAPLPRKDQKEKKPKGDS